MKCKITTRSFSYWNSLLNRREKITQSQDMQEQNEWTVRDLNTCIAKGKKENNYCIHYKEHFVNTSIYLLCIQEKADQQLSLHKKY